jgi:hypothetical protein
MKASKIITLFTLLFILKTSIYSQDLSGGDGYKSSIGVITGTDLGLTFKHFLDDKIAFEGILSTGLFYNGNKFTGLLEFHKPFNDLKGLNWLVGGGMHFGSHHYSYYGYHSYNTNSGGYYDKNGKFHPSNGIYKTTYYSFGFDLILGAEYDLANYPFTFQFQIKPFFDFVNRGSHFFDASIAVRYILNKK